MSVSCNQWDMNNSSSAPAWLIHKMWAAGNAARVLLFTREQGLIWATYRGGSSPKKQALIQAFSPLWVDLSQRQTWYYVRHLESAALPFDFVADHLFAALYMNELLYHGLHPQDPHTNLYDAYVSSLQNLSLAQSQSGIEQALRRFEWTLLASMGYAISLTDDAHSQPIVATQYYTFQAGFGFVFAQEGLLGSHILALSHDELHDPIVLKTAKYVMRAAVDHALGGKRLKSREFYLKSRASESSRGIST